MVKKLAPKFDIIEVLMERQAAKGAVMVHQLHSLLCAYFDCTSQSIEQELEIEIIRKLDGLCFFIQVLDTSRNCDCKRVANILINLSRSFNTLIAAEDVLIAGEFLDSIKNMMNAYHWTIRDF